MTGVEKILAEAGENYFPTALGVAKGALGIAIENTESLLKQLDRVGADSMTIELVRRSHERVVSYQSALRNEVDVRKEKINVSA